MTTVAGTGQTIALTLQASDQQLHGTMPMIDSYQEGGRTYTAGDILERQLRRALFGDDVELPRHLFNDLDDPVAPLRHASVSEEIFRPLLRLLLVEALIGTGRASRIVDLRVGPPTPRGRSFHLSWETGPRHDAGTRQTIDGVVRL